MLKLGDQHFLAETVDDLPEPRACRIFLDCETRVRFDDPQQWNEGGLYPYLGDRACLWAVCFDDEGPAIAVPYRMRFSPNLPEDKVRAWLKRLLQTATSWANHNIKFDAHFAAVDGAFFHDDCVLEDTLTMAKIIDTDRYAHGLKILMRDWLNYVTIGQDRLEAFLAGYKLPRNKKAKDYAIVPSDILGYYACDDVLGNRELFRYCQREMPTQSYPTWEMEKKLTPVLWDMEHAGIKTDKTEINSAKIKSVHKQIQMATAVNRITGSEWADSSAFCYDLLISKWGMPVLSRHKESGNPSFDYDALLMYQRHPDVLVDPVRGNVLKLILDLRAEETFCSLFADVFLEMADANGFVHPSYNQLIRTGRMSCEKPNAQQFDERAKSLCLTDKPGMGFLYSDASQIEFRWIVHYIQDEDAIAAYRRDPKTDFHQWVADLCGIERRNAKNVNFAQAFGAGESKIVSMLSADPAIITAVSAEVDALIAAGQLDPSKRMERFSELCWARGKHIYHTYHDKLPNLKKTAHRAMSVARARGFVFNFYGRRRHLPAKAAHRAFNTLNQGSAMDMIKRRMILTAPRYDPEMRRDGVSLRVNVHDALLHHADDPEALVVWKPKILEKLEAPEAGFRVPVIWESKIRLNRWEEPK